MWHDAKQVAGAKKGRQEAARVGQSNAERVRTRARTNDVHGAMTALHSTPTVRGPEARVTDLGTGD